MPLPCLFLDADSRVGTPWVPSVDGCNDQSQRAGEGSAEGLRRGNLDFSGVQALIPPGKLLFSCNVPVFSAFLYRSWALERGKIVPWLKNGVFQNDCLGRACSLDFPYFFYQLVSVSWRSAEGDLYQIQIYWVLFGFRFCTQKTCTKLRNICCLIF